MWVTRSVLGFCGLTKEIKHTLSVIIIIAMPMWVMGGTLVVAITVLSNHKKGRGEGRGAAILKIFTIVVGTQDIPPAAIPGIIIKG